MIGTGRVQGYIGYENTPGRRSVSRCCLNLFLNREQNRSVSVALKIKEMLMSDLSPFTLNEEYARKRSVGLLRKDACTANVLHGWVSRFFKAAPLGNLFSSRKVGIMFNPKIR